MKLQQYPKTSKNRITLILGILVVALAIGIITALYASGTAPTSNGDFHSSSSPFSPLINSKQVPYDEFASLSKQIEAKQTMP